MNIELWEGNDNVFRIVPFESLKYEEVKDDAFFWFNRESSHPQELHHTPKKEELREAKERLLGPNAPFDYEQITESGILDELIYKIPIYGSPFFIWLSDNIQKRLENLPQGKTLYVVAHTIDRLMRPSGYNRQDFSSSNYTEKDFDIFSRWLQRCFNERTKDIVFVVLHSGTSEEIRGKQSKMGMVQKGNTGGHPRKKISKEKLKEEIVSLAPLYDNNATRIFQYLEKKYGVLPIKKRTAQDWMKEANVSGKLGRPYGAKRKH